MKRKCFTVNPFEMNSYVYWDELSGEGVIIDPGAYYDEEKDEIYDFIQASGIVIKYILNTHGHIDHIMGNLWAKDIFDVPVLMHHEDLPLVQSASDQAKMFGLNFPEPPKPDEYIDEGIIITIGKEQLKVIHTPGHSPGSVCFVDENNKIIFGGDLLFRGSVGRTDLWKGDFETLILSIQEKIFTYEDNYVICPGHMEETTIGRERKTNPFLISN
ncbi:MAG: MBL fold metallo-hydrolase [Ignavibacteria bacterium]|nr:MBL fold metallo-hydrolase [Ignavibacteria bacterium]